MLRKKLHRLAVMLIRRLTPEIAEAVEHHRSLNARTRNERLRRRLQSCGYGVQFNGYIEVSDPRMVSIGNNVHLGANAFIKSGGGLTIGDNTHICRNVTICTESRDYRGTALPFDGTNIMEPVSIGRNVWIGMNVNILPGVTIGDGAVIGLGTTVSKDVADGAVLVGNAAKVAKHRNEIRYAELECQKRYAGRDGIALEATELQNFGSHFTEQSNRCFFVLSTGRSGSTSIADILSTHPQILCRHEPRPQLIRLSTERAHRVKTDIEVISELESLYAKSAVLPEGIYGESDQKLFNLVDILADLLPHAKFIWLIRDANKVVASTMTRGWFKDNEYDPASTDEALKPWQYYRLNGFLCGEYSEDAWERASVFERNCWYWMYVNRTIETGLQKIDPDRWMLVHLEQLTEEIEAVQDFLGVNRRALSVRRSNQTRNPSQLYDRWSVEEKAIFERFCSQGMEQWYGVTPTHEEGDRQVG